MRKLCSIALALVFVAATAATGLSAEYDRYERGDRYRDPGYTPPPRRAAEVPPPRHAVYGQPYFFGQLGVFSPNNDSDGLDGYDSGGHLQFGFGSRVSPFFAVDGTFGAYSAERGSDKATVVPLTIGGRLIIPHPFLEPYVGAGLGLYFSHLEEEARPGFSGIDDSSTDFGGYLSVGLDMWLNQRVALNFEGKYHFVTPTFRSNAGTDFDVNMGGWTGNLGVRVAF